MNYYFGNCLYFIAFGTGIAHKKNNINTCTYTFTTSNKFNEPIIIIINNT